LQAYWQAWQAELLRPSIIIKYQQGMGLLGLAIAVFSCYSDKYKVINQLS
jgi:hypothetical protein